jgi:deoxyribonuclease V
MGIAAHLGLVLDIPTFGVAKSRLFGEAEDPDSEPGSISVLEDPATQEQIGIVVRTKARCKPLVVSPGHRITHDQAVAYTLATIRGYRIPEPTRRAHVAVNQYRRGEIALH